MTQRLVVTIPSRDDFLDSKFHHEIRHEIKGWCMVQVWNKDGRNILLPGAATAIHQIPDFEFMHYPNDYSTVRVPQVSRDYYPLTVVIIG